MKPIIQKCIRILTVPPVMALVLLISMRCSGYFSGSSLIWGICFLCIFPLLSYPLWRILPALYKRGRSSQRALATLFCVLGYVGGIVYCLITHAPRAEFLVFLTYLLSGSLIAVFSYVFKMKCSGHACGVVGPIAMLLYTVGSWGWLGLLLVPLVFWSSLTLKRHTLSELILGSILPIASMAFWILLLP